jgi:threonine/homoserine/homoserine lactone efflux protein
MPEARSLVLFLGSALILCVIPGPAVFYITARSVSQGRRAGLVSVLGIQTGTLVHVAAAALGLSAVLLTSALAFEVVRFLGAGYLILLGVRRLRSRDGVSEAEEDGHSPLAKIFRDGVVVNVLNPKTALFFLAFLPQFVDPSRGRPGLQFGILGLLFIGVAMASDGTWALAASALRNRLRGSPSFLRRERLVSGAAYIGLGVLAAFAGGRRK